MERQMVDARWYYLTLGAALGLALSQFSTKPILHAAAADSEDRMSICTVQTTPSGIPGNPEAIFVLDFSTGRLVGGLLNSQTGKFSDAYFRDIARDFGIDPSAKPKYVMVPGELNPIGGNGAMYASGALYVAEVTSGKCAAYVFRSSGGAASRRNPAAFQMEPLDFFEFRQAVPANAK